MSGFGAKAYRKVGVETMVLSSDPHRLVLVLFDGALNAIDVGRAHMASGRTVEKTHSLSKAIEIVDEGLRVSVDRKAGGELAERLVQLYQFITMRLLQANLRNDANALEEARRILAGLRGAWAQIAPRPNAVPAAPAGAQRAAMAHAG
jgi:flagellar secretion chaperone FliS